MLAGARRAATQVKDDEPKIAIRQCTTEHSQAKITGAPVYMASPRPGKGFYDPHPPEEDNSPAEVRRRLKMPGGWSQRTRPGESPRSTRPGSPARSKRGGQTGRGAAGSPASPGGEPDGWVDPLSASASAATGGVEAASAAAPGEAAANADASKGMRLSQRLLAEQAKPTSCEALSRRLYSCLAGTTVPRTVQVLYKYGHPSWSGLMTLPELTETVKAEFPGLPSYSLKTLGSLFESAATGVVPDHGVTLEAFNKLYCVFLFHLYDLNHDQKLQMSEVRLALDYMAGDIKVPYTQALEFLRGARGGLQASEQSELSQSQFSRLYQLMLGGAKLVADKKYG